MSKKNSKKHKTKNVTKKQIGKQADELTRKRILARIKFGKANKCKHFINIHCTLRNKECDPSSFDCHFKLQSSKSTYKNKNYDKLKSYETVRVKAIVLSHNRKCTYENHQLIDIKAIFKVLTKNNNIVDFIVPAAYCKECDQYIILKDDFKYVKQKGTLLCQVIDKTPEYLAKHRGSCLATESRVHSLGYNVIKQGYDYSFEQRKIILANIIENYGITRHEISSMLDINIARKINLPNYANAVKKWKEDKIFLNNYKSGDIPEVIIDKIIVGKRG